MRPAIIAKLAKRMIDQGYGGMGRTALMKFAFFLQTLKNVPLGYNFRLYTYGPYDSQVLEDLKIAELIGAVESKTYLHPRGRGYTIKPGQTADKTIAAEENLHEFSTAINSVVDEFGARSAVDLEMASTILFVDRTTEEDALKKTLEELTTEVSGIKPRLDKARIRCESERMLQAGYLHAVEA